MKEKITKEQIESIDRAAGTLRAALGGKENDRVKQASDELSRVLQKIGAEIYQKVAAQPKPGAEQTAETKAGPDPTRQDDNVVDAEFREVKDEGSS